MALRPGWWMVFWGLLTSLSLNWILPAFDHHAADYSPFHAHAVVGEASPAERQALLANHAHGVGVAHAHEHAAAQAAGTATDDAAPTVVGHSLYEGLLSLAARATELLSAPAWTLPPPPLAAWLVAGAAVLLLLARPLAPPEQPPRPL